MASTHPTTEASTGELISRVTADISLLIRDELRLAEAEAKAKSKQAGIGLGLFGGAGLVAVFALGAFVAAAILGLATAMDAWLAALIVGGALLIIVGLTALLGKRRMAGSIPPLPTEAIQGLKADVAALRGAIKR